MLGQLPAAGATGVKELGNNTWEPADGLLTMSICSSSVALHASGGPAVLCLVGRACVPRLGCSPALYLEGAFLQPSGECVWL